jgi:hydrogenase maturation protease
MDLDQIRDGHSGGAIQMVSRTVVLGIGNTLLSDDGAGVHVANSLAAISAKGQISHDVTVLDGGTIGLSLLSEIENNSGFIAVDAMELNADPGTVRVFQDSAMDRQLGGKKNTAHEVALSDLMMAARLAGIHPRRRALVAIQPETTCWGLSPTPAVEDALPKAVRCVLSLIEEWHDG